MIIKLGAATGATTNLDIVHKTRHARMPLGHKIVIVGGELVGLELAEFLSERGREVTIVGEAEKFGGGLFLVRRTRVNAELREHSVAMFPAARDIRITPKNVGFLGADGPTKEIDADHVIVAMGADGDSTLANSLRTKGLTVIEVGDCTDISYIEDAIRGAARQSLCCNRAGQRRGSSTDRYDCNICAKIQLHDAKKQNV